tara:strand:+ start:97 stop:753 length:657 start_codon:yes stop_codon:yes gene_type:complete
LDAQDKISDIIRKKTLEELQETMERMKNLDKIFTNCQIAIKRILRQLKNDTSLAVATKHHREIMDFELICDCILDAIGSLNLPEEMKNWKPFPYDINSTIFRVYKEWRFNPISGISQQVTDKQIGILFSSRKKDIEPNSDFSKIKHEGHKYHFTPMQASAVRYMHERQIKGDSSFYQSDVIESIGSSSSYLKDVFKKHEAWNKLIIRVKNNYYKLNID